MTRILPLLLIVALILISCQKEINRLSKLNKGLQPQLSDYAIFKGALSNLEPSDDFFLYELATPLFTDYAEKQRLIKLPKGTVLKPSGNGLPDFPDGTILVKTFFYYKDKTNFSSGKKILETRILLKEDSKWSVGTYVWNPEQNEAVLFESGLNETVNWIDEQGKANVISYHIPNKNACITCHQVSSKILPLGLKIRNLNISVSRNNMQINQLHYFQNSGLMDALDPSSYTTLPDWQDVNASQEERSRAYLDVNCSHCHNSGGFASGSNLFMNYEVSTEETRILQRGAQIIDEMEHKRMPRLGTSVIDKEGLELLKSYLRQAK